MKYSKKKFKELWDSDENGGGITLGDIADCAKDWKLFSTPRIHPIRKVEAAVLKAANCE